MKKILAVVILLCGFLPIISASEKCDQHLSHEEFRNKQQAYITEQAGLSKSEADKFFPVYFELQDKKRELSNETRQLMKKGKDEKTTEAQYEEILSTVYDNRVASDRLDRTYLERFQKILTNKQLFKIQLAEMRFQREMLKGMHRDNKGASTTGSSQKK